ncbi:hypothetical protein ACH5RR_029692 [Cinchona calisaya]|uniref:Uncharacterized protein n=1 Tax=Cinchona calisaya TaxID=153742 RepID=A0ABD2YSD3_9GENT
MGGGGERGDTVAGGGGKNKRIVVDNEGEKFGGWQKGRERKRFKMSPRARASRFNLEQCEMMEIRRMFEQLSQEVQNLESKGHAKGRA